MKYYHIIYNSSEKPMDGGVGFGIRTATENTPEQLLKTIRGIKFFTDDWESYEDKPSPAKMKENPSAIETIAKNYAITNITDEQGKVYYVIARRAYVGFDYSFYKNGMPTRPGNYVIDYYVFDSTPKSQAYEILYEKSLAESNHFIPKSVQPREDNEEMKEISVGAQPALPIEEKPFNAELVDALDKEVVKLFFTYLKSHKEGKKLVVKAGKDKALKLTADLYRMLEPESAKNVRIYVNLRSQGVNDYFDIFFIHEDYPHQIYPGLYDYIEIDSAAMPDTDEAKTFSRDLENLVCSSFAANKDDVYDTLKWLMMPEYSIVKSLSKSTIDSFFCYCIQPGNFTYDNLKDSNGKLNDEFLNVLCSYTKKNKKNAERFNIVVTETMNDATAQDIIKLIEEYNHLSSAGFYLDDITYNVKQNVCSVLLSDINLFKKSIDKLSLKGIQKFFVKTIFESKNEYVDTNTLDSYMLHLYKWFLSDEELKNKNNVLFKRFMYRNMSSEIFYTIIDDIHDDNEDAKVKFFIQILQKELKPFKVVWPYMDHYLAKTSTKYNFLQEFEARIENEQYAPMFYHSIITNKASYSTVGTIEQLSAVLKKNPELKRLVEANYNQDGLYKGLYNELKTSCKANPQKALDAIKQNVLGFLNIKDPSFQVLAFYLELKITGNYDKVRQLNPTSLKLAYKEINEQQDKELFNELLPVFVEASKIQKGDITPLDVAKKYKEYNREAKTTEMLEKLVPSKDKGWIDMISAILHDVSHKDFKEAFDLVQRFGMKSEDIEKLMTRIYAKEYNAYKRKNKVKNFFVSMKNIFTSKKKSNDTDKKKKEETKEEKRKDKQNNKSTQ